MKPVGSSAGGFGSILAGLGTHMNAKKNCLDSVYFHSALQKKLRKHVTGVSVINLSASPLSFEDVVSTGLVFTHISDVDDNNAILLPSSNFSDSKHLLLAKSRVLEKQSFNLTKSFAFNIELSAVPKLSLKKARELAIHEKIMANNDVRQVNKLLDQDFVHVAKAVKNKQSWVFRDLHQILLYTLPVGTTAHDLSNLLESYGGKTCFIGHNPSSYVCNRCVIVCFGNEASKLSAISSVLVYKDVNLCWAGFFLACCAKCKQLGHIFMECSLSGNSGACVSFGGKTWAQVAGGSFSHVVFSVSSGVGVSFGGKPSLLVSFPSDVSGLSDCLAALECSLELLTDQVSDILKRLNGVELVSLAPLSCVFLLAVSVPKMLVSNSDMLVDSVLASSNPLPSNVDVSDAGFGFSISKVLTTKVGGLESKLSALDASVDTVLIADRFDGIHIFMSGLDKRFFGAGVAIIMDSSLVHHVSKVEEVSSRVISVWLLFKGKLSVTFLRLYAGAFFEIRAVVMSVSLGGLLDVCLNSLHKQANRDHWKFKIKDAGCAQWAKFKNLLLAKLIVTG
ncbi:hypothetical protein G9A89_015167 [Geosiphon pyriformis]|nr:hypothetical protein G9A89_015167 [Geosiphon pyriformis]